MIQRIEFEYDGRKLVSPVMAVLAAGYTGRDGRSVRQHIDELAEHGIAPPPRVPMLYPVMPTLLTTSELVAVLGRDTTPEIEVAIIETGGMQYLTIASDHTDRKIEVESVARSKNACPKILGREVWLVSDVRERWDTLQLRATSASVVLQEGALGSLLPLDDLLAFVDEYAGRQPERVILSGTVPTLAVPSSEGATIKLELLDSAADRSLTHSYTVQVLSELF